MTRTPRLLVSALCALLVVAATGALIWPEIRAVSLIAVVVAAMAIGLLALLTNSNASATVNQSDRSAADIEALSRALDQERSRSAAALEGNVDAVLAVDGGNRVVFANEAARRLFLRPQAKLIGNPLVWVLPDEQAIEVLRASAQETQRQTLFIERPNRQAWRLTTTPIANGGDWAAVITIHDLTDARRIEQMRRDFVANVSHELRTPLAALKSVIETLDGGALEDPTAARDFLSRADVEIDRLVQMVEELLELSRIESGEVPLAMGPVDLAKVVSNAVERLRPQVQRRRLTIALEAASEVPPVMGDTARLERAVVNLIQNAVKFTPEGGSIRVSTESNGDSVAVKVHDTGVGIDRADLPRVFERFYKADRARGGEGVGLGLAVVKHTVEAHGGHVSAESERGRGSTFSLTIPAAR